MKRSFLAPVWAVLASGCGEAPPTLSGGKPVTYWVEALQGPDAAQRKTAVFKLGNVGPTDDAVLPALMAALTDADAAVRREAILALMKCGAGARQAVPTLTELERHDRDAQVRSYAAQALEKLNREAAAPE